MIRGLIKAGARRTRRGYALYSLVMSVTLLVSLLGLSAFTVLRIERRSNGRKHEMADARRYAQAAIEMGLLRIKNDPNWRTTYTSGIWESNRPIGDGTYTLEGVDTSDGNLANSQLDPVVLIGTGRVGPVTQKFQVTMVLDPKGLSCLEVAAHAGLDVLFWGGTVDCDQIMSSNDNVYNSGGTVNSDVEAVNFITGVYNGTTDTGIDIREMPNPTTVFDYYIANGTAISYLSLPSEASFRKLENVVLRPSITNPQGIYVINCQGLEVRVQNCRIVGTLVLLDTHPNSQIGLSVNWEPAVGNYPALLVRGPIQLSCDGSELDEAAQGVNFNPASAPYNGFSDLDIDDTYPDSIRGLVYASGDVTIANNPTLEGVLVIGNTLTITDGNPTLNYLKTFLDNPPPGFNSGKMQISPGSWQQKVN